MSLYAVTREAGPRWSPGGIYDQPRVDEHATIVDADDETAIQTRLADDPWVPTEQLRITSIEPWTILVGADRLPIVDAQRITADLSGSTEAASTDA